MFGPCVLVKHQSSSKALLPPPPPPPHLAFRFPWRLTDWPLFLVVSRLAFFFFCCWGRWWWWWCTWRVYVCVCACVILFPDLELIPFKTLLNTFNLDWFMFASTTAPFLFTPPPPSLPSRTLKAIQAGRSNQSLTKSFDGILNAIRSQICVVYCIWYTLLDSYVNLH